MHITNLYRFLDPFNLIKNVYHFFSRRNDDTQTAADMPIDPNEPVYCYCQQVSWGEMVACDNHECEIEWFHYPCVGLKAQPKGKWYCPDCTKIRHRR